MSLIPSFLAALAFLTTLPVPTHLAEADFREASRWFSTVGLVIGALLVIADQGLRWLLPQSVAAVLLLILWVALSGALHWDGLLDCFDALLPPVSTERRLAILKDVHAGSFATVGGGLALLLYLVLLIELPAPRRAEALLLAPILGRWLMSYAQAGWPSARPQGLGSLVPITRRSLLFGAWPLLLLLPAGGRLLSTVLVTFLAGHLLAAWMARRLGGGLTGDCYGAICEIVQLLVLLSYAIL